MRFKHGVIRWHMLAYVEVFLSMFKNCVRIPTYGSYAKYMLGIR